MLEHEPQQENTSTPAPERTRVTAEEFTAAINTLEQRKAEESARLAGTVEIGQTIRDLHIDASPEEVLREVEVQRARKAAQEQAAAEKARAAAEAKERLTTAAIEAKKGLSAAAVLAQSHLQGLAADYQQKAAGHQTPIYVDERTARRLRRKRGAFAWLFPIGMFWFMWSLMTGHIITGFPFGSSHHYGKGGPFISASALQDGHTGWIDTNTALALIGKGGVATDAANLPVSTSRMDNSWQVINHNGELFLHGYVRQMHGDPVVGDVVSLKLFNDDNGGDLNGAEDEAVTIPMKGVHVEDQMQTGSWSDIRVSNVHVDNHFRDMTDADSALDH